MQKILLLTFLLFTYSAFAQSPAENLLTKIEQASDADNHTLVLQLCSELQTLNPPDSILIELFYFESQHASLIEDYALADKSYLALLAQVEKVYDRSSMIYLGILESYTLMLYKSGQAEKVVRWYEKELRAAKEAKQYLNYLCLNFNYGSYYEYIGAMTYAIRYYKEGLNYVEKAAIKENTIHLLLLHNLARVLEIQHRYDQAESLYKEALQIAESTLPEEDEFRYGLVNDFGMLYFFTRRYKKALPYLEFIQKLIDEEKITLEENTHLINNLADCYAHLGYYEKAEAIYLQVEKIERTIWGVSYFNYPTTISRMGDLYAFQGRYEKAEAYHLSAIDLAKKHFSPQDLYLFYNMEQAYLFFEKIKDWEQVQRIALDCFERNCTDEIPASGLLNNIQTLAEKQTFATMPYALKALKIASKSYWELYKIDQDENKLQQAYQLQLATRALLHRLKNSFSTEWDKLELLATTQEISELGILIAQTLYEKTGESVYQNTAFEFLENNKYVLLQEALQNETAKIFGNVPQEIIEQEDALNQDFLMAKTQKIEASDLDSKQKAIENYNRMLNKIDQFKIKLQTEYPTYYQYKYATENASIEHVQNSLSPSSVLLEYFIGKEHVYIYTISKENIHYKVLPISSQKIQQQVQALRNVLSNYAYIIKNQSIAIQKYQELAYWFYKELLAPALHNLEKKEHLIIVPDGLLGHLPFEAFLTKEPNQSKALNQLDFLINQYKISYAYSSNLLLNKSTASKHNGNLLAMGATYTGVPPHISQNKNRSPESLQLRKSLAPLEAISTELEALKPIVSGNYYYGEAANEKRFKEEASKYAILHLAMHGILNDKHPILSSLAFTENGNLEEDNFLQAYEISQMKLQAELVVLSACETGYGKFKQGEGVMSLARSFMYAGVPSMVVSMWQVNDGSTAIIMSEFYKNLAEGMDKAAALQNAKLYYIQHAKTITAHPAFWAPFIQLGDASPIQLQKENKLLFWGIAILGLCFILCFFFIRRKEKQSA